MSEKYIQEPLRGEKKYTLIDSPFTLTNDQVISIFQYCNDAKYQGSEVLQLRSTMVKELLIRSHTTSFPLRDEILQKFKDELAKS
jgi:hypothetical protein